jgi:hypothetical protein
LLLKDLGEDYYYIGFVEHWNSHLDTLHRQRLQLDARLKEEWIAEEGRRAKEEVRPLKIIPVQKAASKL